MAPDDDPKDPAPAPAPAPASSDDPTVKALLSGESELEEVVDEATRRELERWFGLPSADALDAEPDKPRDADLAAAKERRANATAAVDPGLLGRIDKRIADWSEEIFQFKPNLEVHVDPGVALFDTAMLAKIAVVADPRDFERPDDLADEMKSCAPQALLRDLHRPVTDFSVSFERVDIAAQQRLDIVAEVKTAMATSWKLPPLGRSPFLDCRELLEETRKQRNQSWPEVWKTLKLTNRREAES
jgi:hypothetical protein